MKLYFRDSHSGNDFISVVTAPDGTNVDVAGLGVEIDEAKLPKDFDSWKFHTSFIRGVKLIEVWSSRGDSDVTRGMMIQEGFV